MYFTLETSSCKDLDLFMVKFPKGLLFGLKTKNNELQKSPYMEISDIIGSKVRTLSLQFT